MWLAASAAFLAFYIGVSSLPATAIAPHIRVVATLWLAVAVLRIVAQALPGRRMPRLASAVIVGAAWTMLLGYYVLVIVGLNSWGQIVTADLIRTYALQFPALVDALGFSMTMIVAGTVLGMSLIIGVAGWYTRRLEWESLLRSIASPAVMVVVCVASIAIVAIETHEFLARPWTFEREPVSLTMFPREARHQIETHRIDRVHAALLDRAEDAARAAYVPAETSTRPNMILIVVDALRADHVGLLGYRRNTTPNLDAFARKANRVMATTIHSSCAESACGLISLASSKYVHQFSDRPITLGEVLKRNGYTIDFILGGDHTHFYGLREAYGYVDTYFDASMAPGYYMNDDEAVIAHVASLSSWDGNPVMFQFHLMSTHALGKRQSRFQIFLPAENYSTITKRPPSGGVASPIAVNYYDNGVLQTDYVIAELLRLLKEKGYLSNAIVAVTADHGELLGEHNLYTHSKSVYEEVLRVPFILLSIVKGAGGHDVVESAHGSQVDVAPTLLDELGIPIPATWSGIPLQSNRTRRTTYYQEGSLVGLCDYRSAGHLWKYYVDSRSGLDHVVDLMSDPQERDDERASAPKELIREWRSLVLPLIRSAVD